LSPIGFDHGADIVDDDVLDDLKRAGIRIDLELADMAAVGIGEIGRRKRAGLVEPAFEPRRQIGGAKRRLGHLGQGDMAVGAGDGEIAFGELDIGLRRFEQVGGDAPALAMILSAAIHKAEPPITVEREPLVPMPKATRSVSPSMNWMSVGSIPSFSLNTCLNVVSCPGLVLAAHQEGRVAARVKADLGEFLAGPGAFSIGLAMPMPRSLPRVCDSARRAANPLQSESASTLSWLATKSPQS